MPRWPYLTIQAACDDIKISLLARADLTDGDRAPVFEQIEILAIPLIDKRQANFTEPSYNHRWIKPISRELLNEYLSYRISGFTGLRMKDVEDQLKPEHIIVGQGEGAEKAELYQDMLQALKKQKRINLDQDTDLT